MHADQPHTTRARHNLSPVRTSFVGRERAIAEVRRLLGRARLLTLTGSGGSGKTRLAMRVAQEALAEYPAGVWWVDLAALTDPGLLPETVAGVLGLAERPDRSFTELLADHLREHAALLIFDNCEHLRAACRKLLGVLVATDGAARLLATSREPLNVEGEQIWTVPLLALPDPRASQPVAELQEIEAVGLFVERARAVAPAFRVNESNAVAVAQICRRLEGLPLGIELAAARVNVLAPRQIVERLDDSVRLLTRGALASDARHQTLRTAMDWSFDLISAHEQMLFTRLAVFAGSFALEAVEGVCAGLGLERDDLLDLLASLVEKSLVIAVEQGEEMRYRLLEPIRQYAAAQLRAGDEEARWRERHSEYFLALAERAEPELRTPDQARWLDRLEREHGNSLAALAWCAANTRAEIGLRLASGLNVFWQTRGYLSEGQRWIGDLLARADATVAPEVRIRALNASASLSVTQGNATTAHGLLEQSLALAYQVGYEEGIESALIRLGATLCFLGDYPAALARLEEAVRRCRAAGHQHALVAALRHLGEVHQTQSETAQAGVYARACYEEALAIDRQLGNHAGVATTLFDLASLAEQGGDCTGGWLRYQEVLATFRKLGDRPSVANTLINLGLLSLEMDDLATAAASLAEVEQISQELGNSSDLGFVCAGRGEIAFYSGQYTEARAHYHEALSLFQGAGNKRQIGRALDGLGRIAVREGNLEEAARRFAEALTLRRTFGLKTGMIFALDRGYIELAVAIGRPAVAARLLAAVDAARQVLARPRKPMELREVERIKCQLRAQLGDVTFSSVWNEGRAMSLEQVVAYALDELSPAAVVRPRPELRIFALGPVRVYCGDRLLTSADWIYAKARELVLYLLCHPHATREQIGVELWPEATTGQVRQRFSAALAHARGALGRDVDWITLASGHYSFNRARPYWFDVEVFESSLHEAQSLLRTVTQDEQTARLLEEAVNLYQHDFAEDVLGGEWHTARREALRHAYVEALLALARLHTDAGRDEQAIAVYRCAIAKDAFLEDAHLEVIRAYGRLGKRRQAFDQYEMLRGALAELGAAPSAETQALIEGLRRDDPL